MGVSVVYVFMRISFWCRLGNFPYSSFGNWYLGQNRGIFPQKLPGNRHFKFQDLKYSSIESFLPDLE